MLKQGRKAAKCWKIDGDFHLWVRMSSKYDKGIVKSAIMNERDLIVNAEVFKLGDLKKQSTPFSQFSDCHDEITKIAKGQLDDHVTVMIL